MSHFETKKKKIIYLIFFRPVNLNFNLIGGKKGNYLH